MRWFLVFFGLLGGIAAWVYRTHWPEWPQLATRPPAVNQQLVNASSDQETIFATGFVEGTNEEAQLRFEIPGRIVEIFVSEGDQVQKGDLLASLDPSVLKQKVVQAEAELALAEAQWVRAQNAARPEARDVARSKAQVAQAEVDQSQDEVERTQKLYKRSVASEAEWKKTFHQLQVAKARHAEFVAQLAEVEAPARQDELKIAQARIEVARAALEQARLLVGKTKLLAPHAGTVLDVMSQVGELVDPSDSQPVFVFANLKKLRVRAYVEELHALSVNIGDEAHVTADGLPGRHFPGQVIFQSPQMDQKKHRTHKPNELLDIKTREILIELNSNSELVVGLPVEVTIFPTKKTIPSSKLPSDLSITGNETEKNGLSDAANKGNTDVLCISQSLESPIPSPKIH